MQLTIISIVVCLLLLIEDVKGQFLFLKGKKNQSAHRDTTDHQVEHVYERPAWKQVEIDFLSSYYSQDGNNAAVTGGLGSEQLTDFTQKISVKVPIQKKLSLNLDAGYDYYSSASTDQIDNVRSSDSAQDMRVHGNLGITFNRNDTESFGLRLGTSTEYDYFSLNGGFHYMKSSRDQNTTLYLQGQAFIDRWSIIYPKELRNQGRLVPTDQRQSYNAALTISHIINKRMQASIQLEGIYMSGLLSTPFHRVYFADTNAPRVEQLPQSKIKLPIGVRLNTAWSDKIITRLYYRYYWDDWGMSAHTASIELPIKINRFLAITPHYRYHMQSAADYFAPFGEHMTNESFYSSDFDLSALDSHSIGLGMNYSPVKPILRIPVPLSKNHSVRLTSLDVKYSHYQRSTGLKANIISLGIGISI